MQRGVLFSYLFFSLFVFVAVSLLVSKFSLTFSQLFFLFSQNGRVFAFVCYALLVSGFLLCLYALIVSSWNHQEDLRMKSLIVLLCLGFVILFVFVLCSATQPIALLDLILKQQQHLGITELLLKHWIEFFVFGFFYICFIFFPLGCQFLGISPNPKHAFGNLLTKLKPSINVAIYALLGSALQSYWHKSHFVFYLDVLALILGLALLWGVYVRRRREFGFYEHCNLSFLCLAVLIFALCSNLITEDTFIVRYDILLLAFLAWCAEWMLEFCSKKEEDCSSKVY